MESTAHVLDHRIAFGPEVSDPKMPTDDELKEIVFRAGGIFVNSESHDGGTMSILFAVVGSDQIFQYEWYVDNGASKDELGQLVSRKAALYPRADDPSRLKGQLPKTKPDLA